MNLLTSCPRRPFSLILLAFLVWRCDRCPQPALVIASGRDLSHCKGIRQKHLCSPEAPTSGDLPFKPPLQQPAHAGTHHRFISLQERPCVRSWETYSPGGKVGRQIFENVPSCQGRSTGWGQREAVKGGFCFYFLPCRAGRQKVLSCMIYVDLFKYLIGF